MHFHSSLLALTGLALTTPLIRAEFNQFNIQFYPSGGDCRSGYYGEKTVTDTGANQQFDVPGLPDGTTTYDISTGEQKGNLPTIWACPANTAQGDYTNCFNIPKTYDKNAGAELIVCYDITNSVQIQIED